jgi:sugar lactone lactonase YvrE
MSTDDTASDLVQVIGNRPFLENPRWHDGRIWVSDHYNNEVIGVSPDGSVEVSIDVPDRPSGLGWLQDGRLLIVQWNVRQLVAHDSSGKLDVHANLSEHAPNGLNDMVVDSRTDTAYVGPIGFDFFAADPTISGTKLARVTPDGEVMMYGDGLVFPNGHAISPDGDTLVVAETFGSQITAFDLDADGTPTNQRVWADFGASPETDDLEEHIEAAVEAGLVMPDGIVFDAEGALWAADPFNHRAVRVHNGGEITDTVNYDKPVTAAMLGGDDGRTLYLCATPAIEGTAAMNASGSELVTKRVDVGHAGQP